MKLVCQVPWFVRGFLAAVFLTVATARADQTSFSSTLSEENKAAAGLAKLTAEQIASLDTQVAHEVDVARQGNTPAFATSFTHRRTPQQRKDAGLDQLLTPELKRLDELVAAEVATPPAPTGPIITKPATATSSASDWVDVTPRKWDVHGELTLAYMWGSGGRSGYGAEMATTATDPSGTFSATLVLSQFQFKDRGSHHPGEYACDRGW